MQAPILDIPVDNMVCADMFRSEKKNRVNKKPLIAGQHLNVDSNMLTLIMKGTCGVNPQASVGAVQTTTILSA